MKKVKVSLPVEQTNNIVADAIRDFWDEQVAE